MRRDLDLGNAQGSNRDGAKSVETHWGSTGKETGQSDRTKESENEKKEEIGRRGRAMEEEMEPHAYSTQIKYPA